MSSNKQANRPLTFDCPLGADKLFLRGLTGREGISKLFRFQLDLIADNKTPVPFESILGQKVTAHVALAAGGKRHFNGFCSRISQGARDPRLNNFTAYTIEIVPGFWLLSRVAQSRIFQHMSVPDILKKVLAPLSPSLEIKGTFEKRDYCAQYRETDFNFASRLMEEEGIYYYFKHSDGDHKMVIANTPSSHVDLPGPSALIFEGVLGGKRDEDRVIDWEKVQELRSGKYTLHDHSFELPHKNLEAQKTIQESVSIGTVSHKLKVGGNDKFEIYDYPGEYAQRFDGVDKGGGDQPAELQKIFADNQRTVAIRMEEEAVPSIRIRGASNVRQMVAGHKFTLQRHFNADGGPYVVTDISHDVSGAGEFRPGETGHFEYRNEFFCIPLALPFRPPRVTPKPVVPGTQTAVIVGPPGEEIFVDKYSRVKVQFHWDREGKHDPDSSCWMRVASHWAGRQWGLVHIPRIGQEVVVDFLEGDPDQPIIVGSVYNADMMPPYKLPLNKTLSGLKSQSSLGGTLSNFNEIRFEDKKGKEQLFVHAEKNMDEIVNNASAESVYGNKHLTVGGEKDGKKWGDYKELVYQDVHLHNKRNLEQQVGGDMKLLIGGEDGSGKLDLVVKDDRKALITKNDHLHVKGSRSEKIDGGLGLGVGGAFDAKVGTKFALDSGEEIHLKAGMKVVIEAGAQLSLKASGSFIDIGPAGIAISGTMVLINSGGSAGSGSGAKPGGPTDAQEAGPATPTPADNPKTGY